VKRLLNIADTVSSLLLAAAVIVAARIWAGAYWFPCAVAAIAALSARREASRLYVRGLPPAIRQKVVGPREEAAEPLKDLARRQGLRYPAVVFWPDEDFPHGDPAAYYLIQGKPIFLVNDRLPEMLSSEETLSVFAHELSHHLLGHVKRFALARVLADVAAGAAACGAASELSIAAVAEWELMARAATVLAVLVAARAFLHPALNAYSRRQELQADRKALQITGDRNAFVAAYSKLAARRGARNEPPRLAHLLFSGSPTLAQRLAVAKERP